MNKRFKLDVHTHTVASGHAYSTIDENARYAGESGLSLMGVSDHAPKMPGTTHPFYFLNLKIIPREMYGVKILRGAELNILNTEGKVDLKNNLLKRLDYAIASLHVPCMPPENTTMEENTQALINVMKSPYVNIIGHPGDPRYPIDIKRVVTAARDNNVLLEINNASLNPFSSRAGGEVILEEIVLECKKQGMPIILGSDAHFYSYIGGFDHIIPMVDRLNIPDELIINTDVDKFLSFLKLKDRSKEE